MYPLYCYPVKGVHIKLGGDTDFNFNEKHYPLFERIILHSNYDSKEKRLFLSKLELCKVMHHNLLNFSLVQVTGAMNNFKGIDCGDRLDLFLNNLNNYYITNDNDESDNASLKEKVKNNTKKYNIFSKCTVPNMDSLKIYLDSFRSMSSMGVPCIDNYCKEVYFIDESIVKKLLENANKYPTLNISGNIDESVKAINKYMDLAIEFWYRKLCHFTNTTPVCDKKEQ